MKSKKIFPIITILLVIGLLLSACGGEAAPENPVQEEESVSEPAPTEEAAEVSEEPVSEEETEEDIPDEVPIFSTSSPVAPFSDSDIQALGVDCQGSPDEIADCVKTWQEENMLYCQNMDVEDCSDAIRANYVLPGLYTSLDLIKDKKQDGKVYGICMDYAVIYCSIAEYYGLECRVVNSITKPSERPGANWRGSLGHGAPSSVDQPTILSPV